MKFTSIISLTIVAIMSSGCTVKHAQNNAEFRQMTPSNSYGKHEAFTINNTYSNAVSNFKKRSEACLNTAVVLKSYDRNTGAKIAGEQTLTYTPTLTVGSNKSELSVQKNVSGAGMIMGKVPENGMYIFLADIAKDGKKSRLDVYYITYMGTDQILNSVKNWASGTSLDCPDLTK